MEVVELIGVPGGIRTFVCAVKGRYLTGSVETEMARSDQLEPTARREIGIAACWHSVTLKCEGHKKDTALDGKR